MKDEQQIIAIAEACGFYVESYRNEEGEVKIYAPCFPDYLEDLNAMHEAEEALTTEQLYTMLKYLSRARRSTVCGVAVMRATARQRAEAFLRALNLWEETT